MEPPPTFFTLRKARGIHINYWIFFFGYQALFHLRQPEQFSRGIWCEEEIEKKVFSIDLPALDFW